MPGRRTTIGALGAVLVIAIGAALVMVWPFGETTPAHIETEISVPSGAEGAAATPHSDAASAPAPPDSLRDTESDGSLTLGADGHFVPDRGALALFDYFLSATGEEPAPTLRARIVAEIAQRLPPDAAREAEAFLDRYLGYREAARRISEDDRLALGADLERRLQWLRELRREHFGAALAERLFGDEERSIEIALERRRIAWDASLTPEERRTRIEALEAELPDAARRARAETTLPLRLHQQEAALRESGADAATIRTLREESVGIEAADRLAELDARRAAWQGRVEAYRAERAAIEGDPSIDTAERDAQVEALRARRFDPTERLRVQALDDIEALR